MDAIVSAQNLTKKYKELTAVDGITFEIRPGECFGLLGPNGAGKTSTIKMIHCVSPVTSGTLLVNGMPAGVDNRRIKKTIGVVPQELDLDPDLTVNENLDIFAQFYDLPRKEITRQIEDLLKFVELRDRCNSKIEELSTGMKRRLLIGRALINQPRLIIADEPTTGLDPQARHLIWQRLRQLKTQGVTMLLTTQYMEEAEQLCDRLVIMHQGHILKEGTPSGLIAEVIGRDVVEVRQPEEKDGEVIGKLGGIEFEHERIGDTLYLYSRREGELMRRIVDLNLPKVLNRPASLEDVFLKLTGRSLIE